MAILDIRFNSFLLKRKITIKAILPGDPFNAYSGQAFRGENSSLQSLYLFHGFGGDCSDWLENTDIQRIAGKNNLAVFLVSGENSFYVDSHGDTQWETFIAQELVGYTRRLFPLSHSRQDTFVAGNSMGGFGALNIGLGHPEIFGKVVALSSALILDTIDSISEDYVDNLANYAYYQGIFGDLSSVAFGPLDPRYRAKKAVQAHKQPRLYLMCGTEDFLIEQNREFVRYVRDIPAEVLYEELPGKHDWEFWSSRTHAMVQWLVS
ncbi:alpha/beta hydrolase [Alloscardovia criceti]|uniref:alpha/beta hydrolase n=1 Tax=Alloscardovia criceti TaxID=356828 RepID=UPI00035C8241|nr:alpha/beta hydrolase family protein [Alloscardovia criceti]